MGNKNTTLTVPINITKLSCRPKSIQTNQATVEWNSELVDPSFNIKKSKKLYQFKFEYYSDYDHSKILSLPLIEFSDKKYYYKQVLKDLDQDTKYVVKLYIFECSKKKDKNTARAIRNIQPISCDFKTLNLKAIQDAENEKKRQQRFNKNHIYSDILVTGSQNSVSAAGHVYQYICHVIPFNQNKYQEFITNHKHGQLSPFTTFFKENNIQIKNIFANKVFNLCLCIIWITTNDKVYAIGGGSGVTGNSKRIRKKLRSYSKSIREIQSILCSWDLNNYYKERAPKLVERKKYFIPKLVEDLCGKNITHISFDRYNAFKIARSSSSNYDVVIKYWYKNLNVLKTNAFIPNDIIVVIGMFCGTNNVFYITGDTEFGFYRRKIDPAPLQNIETNWLKMDNDLFKTQNIIKIALYSTHCLLLSSDGNVFDFGGFNQYGDKDADPKRIEYFVDNGICVKDIACGSGYSLAVDTNGRLYGWGDNKFGQCGEYVSNKSYKFIQLPKVVEYFKNDNIVEMECNHDYSYVKTADNKHYLFGHNKDNRLLYSPSFENQKQYTLLPHCINDVVYKRINKKIVSVSLDERHALVVIENM